MRPIRPPTGIEPAWLWRELHPRPERADIRARASALEGAIERYRRAGRVERTEWVEELAALRRDHRLPA
jgi:hypothetical protein